MSKINIYLDDYRNPSDSFSYTKNKLYLEEKWVVVKDYKHFVRVLDMVIERNLEIGIISLDHDLAPEHYQDYLAGRNFLLPDDEINLNYDRFEEKTGYDCGKYLIEFCEQHNINLPDVLCHSMNPVGKTNIMYLLHSYKQDKDDGTWNIR